MLTFEIFLSFWQKVSLDLTFPGMQAGDEASYVEWTESDGQKCYGMRKPDGARHGIFRMIAPGQFIREETYCEDKQHGLSFYWFNYGPAFHAAIYDHGERKACIYWKSDWSELYSTGNKELILMNNGLSIFKP